MGNCEKDDWLPGLHIGKLGPCSTEYSPSSHPTVHERSINSCSELSKMKCAKIILRSMYHGRSAWESIGNVLPYSFLLISEMPVSSKSTIPSTSQIHEKSLIFLKASSIWRGCLLPCILTKTKKRTRQGRSCSLGLPPRPALLIRAASRR